MKEEYDGEITQVKLSESEIKQILKGKILRGHRVRVGMVTE